MATPNPMADPSVPTPEISVREIQMCGLLVDVYGLSELPASTTHVSVLWLHHPRGRSKGDMKPTACAILDAFHKQQEQHSSSRRQEGKQQERGMIAAVWDQRNHGGRKVSDTSNNTWRAGNETHAQDMYGVIAGCVADTKGLMDAVEGYLFLDDNHHDDSDSDKGWEKGKGKVVDQHLVLGVSLGGHTAWQLMWADERVEAGVMVIGCPDFMYLLKDRARRSKRKTFRAEEKQGKPFLGSKDFPPSLIEACKRADPKGIVFGTGPISTPHHDDTAEETTTTRHWHRLFDQHHLRHKKFLSCSGKDDKLVPYSVSKPFLDFFADAARTWYKDSGMKVEDKVYEGVGHSFSPEMLEDATKFLLETVGEKERKRGVVGSKI